MDLLTALLACNLYTSDEPLVRAIAQSNSHGNQYAVVDPSLDYTDVNVPPEPTTLEAAVARLSELTSKGGHPLLGLMQVRPEWMGMFGREISQAFGVCVNISVGSAMLSAMDQECARESPFESPPPGRKGRRDRLPVVETLTPRRTCVVRKYGQTIGSRDFGLLIRLELGAQSPVPSPSRSRDAPVFFPSTEKTWGPDCILVPATSQG